MKFKLTRSHSIWFTGYPSSGKSTIAKFLQLKLKSSSIPAIILDGDYMRKYFLKDKNYTRYNRVKSVQYYIGLVKLLMQIKVIIIVAANHAFKEQRKLAKKILKKKYSEIWISTPLKICKKRDVKGLYQKAKKNKLKNLVGHDLKFDRPENYDYKISTSKYSKSICAFQLLKFLEKKGIIKNERTA